MTKNEFLRTLIGRVDCGGGAVMSFPKRNADGSVVWHLTYGNAEAVKHVSASIIESYAYLLSAEISMKEATRRLRLLRKARKET